jgi:EAL domain-containing protein (putative c-di-GMP-specific phosphodiesterase class I)
MMLVATAPPETVAMVKSLMARLNEPYESDHGPVRATVSVGVASCPNHGTTFDELSGALESSIDTAKRSGRASYCLFSDNEARRQLIRRRLISVLHKPEPTELQLVYQPVYGMESGATGEMMSAEALLRWDDPELGPISPLEFVPVAEKSEYLIVQLGEWVLGAVSRQIEEWGMSSLQMPPVSVNLSGSHLRSPKRVDSLLDALSDRGIHTSAIELEFTETGLLDTSALAREGMLRMRNAGIVLALDEFGVGFSSLSHLRDLPLNKLKLERSYTVDCMRDAKVQTIAKGAIDMAHGLGVSVVAKGLETNAQITWMQHLGCDQGQGRAFAPPMPADKLVERRYAELPIARKYGGLMSRRA